MSATNSTAPASQLDDVIREKEQVHCAEQIEFEFAADMPLAERGLSTVLFFATGDKSRVVEFEMCPLTF
jgi:hypothetical protein